MLLATHLAADPLQTATQALVLHRGQVVYDGPAGGLGSAVQQRVVFTMNGAGRGDLRAALAALPEVQVAETPGAMIATTRAGRAFDLLAAVAAAGVRPIEVHVEEPVVAPARLRDLGTEPAR